jgi:hypothetical protein
MMENGENSLESWVKERMDLLEPAAGWNPDAAAALARFRARRRRARFRRGAVWSILSVAAACVALLVLQNPRACATPRACAAHWWNAVFPSATGGPAGMDAALAPYKQMGSPNAPLTCEIYTDYECPACARLYRETVPLLIRQFVRTGQVKLVHRDYPLAQHRYARLAARYANAAGEAGYYEQAVERIFQTQEIWSRTGDVAAQLAPALPAAVMRRVQELARNDAALDQTVAADIAMGRRDRLTRTPTLVIVWKGNRQAIAPVPEFPRLREYLEEFR